MKETSTSHNTSSSHSSKPFFNISGKGAFFSDTKEIEKPFFTSSYIQPKPISPSRLNMGQPDDIYKQKADAIAEDSMQLRENGIQRLCNDCEKEDIRTKPEGIESSLGSNQASSTLTSQLNNSGHRGSSLPSSTNQFMSNAFRSDFSTVRVHTDKNAIEMNNNLNSRAFTHGSDIYFNKGEYAPHSYEGKRLLAHELTHVVQQQDEKIRKKRIQKADLSSPRLSGNPLFERALDNKTVIEYGDNGREVRRVQQMLIDLGYSLPRYGADGKFGNETKNAVKAFQNDKGLKEDGRVGFRTIKALDNKFPTVKLPPNRTGTWNMACILQILCPWNKNLVENILPTFTINTFDSRTYPTETWDGANWVTSIFDAGGYLFGTTIGLLNLRSCEDMASTIYHEGWHAQRPSALTGLAELEKDAYINTEQWSIDMRVPGGTPFTNKATGVSEDLRTTAGNETVVDEAAIETMIRQEYGGVSAVSGESILARVGATNVRVRRPNGSEYVRPARVGESVQGSATMTNPVRINPADWRCP